MAEKLSKIKKASIQPFGVLSEEATLVEVGHGGVVEEVVVLRAENALLRAGIKRLEGLLVARERRDDDDAKAGRDDDPVCEDAQNEGRMEGSSNNVRTPCGTEDVVKARDKEKEPLQKPSSMVGRVKRKETQKRNTLPKCYVDIGSTTSPLPKNKKRKNKHTRSRWP